MKKKKLASKKTRSTFLTQICSLIMKQKPFHRVLESKCKKDFALGLVLCSGHRHICCRGFNLFGI